MGIHISIEKADQERCCLVRNIVNKAYFYALKRRRKFRGNSRFLCSYIYTYVRIRRTHSSYDKGY